MLILINEAVAPCTAPCPAPIPCLPCIFMYLCMYLLVASLRTFPLLCRLYLKQKLKLPPFCASFAAAVVLVVSFMTLFHILN